MTTRSIATLSAAGLAALALAAPAGAATSSACYGELDLRYGAATTPEPAAGPVDGGGTLRCAGRLADRFSLGAQGPLQVGPAAGWSGTCALGELSLPIAADQRALLGEARLTGHLTVQRAAGAWRITGSGEAVGIGLLGTTTSTPVTFTGTAVAAPSEACAAEHAVLELLVTEAGEEPTPPPVAAAACEHVQQGTPGADRLSGTPEGDALFGRGGPDRIAALGGADCLVGGGGRDRLAAGPGDDHVDAAGGGRDRVRCGGGRDVVSADAGDRLAGCERVHRTN